MEAANIAEDHAPDPTDIMRILLATDNHLGYGEKVPIKAEDSFIAFDEILEIAIEKDVDFVLLGGDLFHENKPSIVFKSCLQFETKLYIQRDFQA